MRHTVRASRRSPWTSAVLFGLIPCFACAPPPLTQLVVVVETDYDVPEGLSSVSYEVSGASGDAFETTVDLTVSDAPSFPLTLTLTPRSASSSTIEVVITGYARDTEVARRVARTSFVRGESRMLRIALTRSCADVSCETGTSCTESGCENDEIDPSGLPPWPTPAGGSVSIRELCNGRDDDGDGVVDNGFMFDSDVDHCGACFRTCPDGPSASPTCSAIGCGLTCAPGRGDCDGDDVNGCETDLTTAADCGSCGNGCMAATPLCSVTLDGASCVSGCDPGQSRCGRTCIDTETSLAHCGGCDLACVDPGPGSVVCDGGTCDVTCDLVHVPCDGVCTRESATACGPTCMSCTAGPNQVAACTAGDCSTSCAAGWADCNGAPADGCEVELDASPNCGACGIDCGYGTCSDSWEGPRCSNRATSVAVGPRHSCAALADGRVYCWGDNTYGQLGDGTSTARLVPTRVVGLTGAGRLAADARTTYMARGGLLYWGDDPTTDPTVPDPLPSSPSMLHPLPVGYFSVAAGRGAFTSPDSVNDGMAAYDRWGWGDTSRSALGLLAGDSRSVGAFVPPILVTECCGEHVPAAGANWSCDVTRESDERDSWSNVHCWGRSGGPGSPAVYLGHGSEIGSDHPVPVIEGGPAYMLASVGTDTACVQSVGELRCWGAYTCGAPALVPTVVPGASWGSGFPAAGSGMACAISNDGLYCIGRNWLSTRPEDACATSIVEVARGDIAEVEIDADHGCYIRSGGVFCWGLNTHGQLGNGSTSDASAPPSQVVFR